MKYRPKYLQYEGNFRWFVLFKKHWWNKWNLVINKHGDPQWFYTKYGAELCIKDLKQKES